MDWTAKVKMGRERVERETGYAIGIVVVRPEVFTALCVEAGDAFIEIFQIDDMLVGVSEALSVDYQFFVDPYTV